MTPKSISRGQKRVLNLSPKSSARRALHLFLGDEHDIDRVEAEKLRQYHLVPRKKQHPFPFARVVGFTGCWFETDRRAFFKIQEKNEFVQTFTERLKMSYYLRKDRRGNRKARPQPSSPIETNIALRTGLSLVLAELARAGEVNFVHSLYVKAATTGMEVLEKRTGYRRSYMAGHPDAQGTLSVHFGLWSVDKIEHKLIGRSANGKPGRKGLRTLGHCFRSLLLLDDALPLPLRAMERPKKNLSTRDPDDWAALQAMNQVVEAALSRRRDGPELLAKAKKYQEEAAEDWLRRSQGGSGMSPERQRQQRERRKRAVMKWAAKREEKFCQEIAQKEERTQKAIEENDQTEERVTRLKEELQNAKSDNNKIANSAYSEMKKLEDDLANERIKASGLEVAEQKAMKELETLGSNITTIREVVKKLGPLMNKVWKLIPAEARQLLDELATLLDLEVFMKPQKSFLREQSPNEPQ